LGKKNNTTARPASFDRENRCPPAVGSSIGGAIWPGVGLVLDFDPTTPATW